MNHQRTDRIRRAAILVASLEESVAEQMLASLSPEESALVLKEVERLEELDPQEFADVLAEFRSVAQRGRVEADAVEFTYSNPANRDGLTKAPVSAGLEQNDGLAEADVSAIAELLANEQPQIIAVALSRLSHDQGSAVFAALPEWLQPEVLERIATLEQADADAAAEVESLLLSRMEHHRQQRRQAAVGAELARRIISRTSPEAQQALLGRIARADARPAPRDAGQDIGRQGQHSASVVRLARLSETAVAFEAPREDASEVYQRYDEGQAAPSAPAMIDDLSGELERLSDEALLVALQQADEQLVHRALAASSEKFLKRVIGKLSRRQARSVRKRLRAMGPTRLADLRQAQWELLQLADGAASLVASASGRG